MKKGDLVTRRKQLKKEYRVKLASDVGVILDIYEDMSSTYYEVAFAHDRGWFEEFQLELLKPD